MVGLSSLFLKFDFFLVDEEFVFVLFRSRLPRFLPPAFPRPWLLPLSFVPELVAAPGGACGVAPGVELIIGSHACKVVGEIPKLSRSV